MDVEQYGRLSRLPPLSVSKVFDVYRTLMRQLEEKRVYSKDRLETSASTGGCVVLDAVFPPTYGKSSLGIGLTEAEKQERTTKLNMWMAALLTKYAHCTPEAQELIHAFLSLDEDNPAEPANKTIHAVLKKTFRPMKVPPPPSATDKKKGHKKSAAAGTTASGEPGATDDGTVGTGCACIIS